MKRILFVCLGNICRSPMAEIVFRDLVERAGRAQEYFIASAGTSGEEEGNPVDFRARRELESHGLRAGGKRAARLAAGDYDRYDLLIGMETRNVREMIRICGGDPDRKIRRLTDWTDAPRDIADPWYTGNFSTAFREIERGCEALFNALESEEKGSLSD